MRRLRRNGSDLLLLSTAFFVSVDAHRAAPQAERDKKLEDERRQELQRKIKDAQRREKQKEEDAKRREQAARVRRREECLVVSRLLASPKGWLAYRSWLLLPRRPRLFCRHMFWSCSFLPPHTDENRRLSRD